MSTFLTNILKNMGCSYCQEFEFENNKDHMKSWKLYIKKFEMFTAFIMVNNNINKDISTYIKKDETFLLMDDKNEIFIKLEYVAYNEENNISVLVPSDEYHELYQKLEEVDKEFNKELGAYYIGMFNIKKNG
jgi:hypothetical protein